MVVLIDPNVVVSVSDFYAAFPAFEEGDVYSDFQVSMYLELAFENLPIGRWGNLKPLGSMWWTAHFLTLDGLDQANADAGRTGMPLNPVASKSLGGASISYDTQSGLELGGGFWNSTSYGRRFYRFLRMAGMGGIQIGGSREGQQTGFLPRVAYGTGGL